MANVASIRESDQDASLSLFLLLDPEILANPYPLFKRIRTTDPVHWDVYLHSWVVTRYEDVVDVLRKFSAARTQTPEQLRAMGLAEMSPVAAVLVKQMLFLDAPAHTRIRSLASAAFMPAQVASLRGRIEQIADDLLDRVHEKGEMDIIADFANRLPAIITAAMLGVPEGDHEQLKVWSESFAEILGNFQNNPDRIGGIVRTVEHMTAYFRERIREQKRSPRVGLVHSLLKAEVDGDRLTEEEVIANCIITMVGGQETTTNLIGNGLLLLLRNPSELERLRRNPALLPSAVEELLRYDPPTQHTARVAPYDLEMGGKTIKRGEGVIAVMAAANRDPERFPDPDRLHLSRADNRHLSFGWAAHFCFGAPLARIEGQVAFDRLIRLPNLRLKPVRLAWRTNLALRGLTALPVEFDPQPPNRHGNDSVV